MVKKTVEELSDSDLDLTCGQRITDIVISDEEVKDPKTACSKLQAELSCSKQQKLFGGSDTEFGKTLRSLKRAKVMEETAASSNKKQKRSKNQKTLLDQPLVLAMITLSSQPECGR